MDGRQPHPTFDGDIAYFRRMTYCLVGRENGKGATMRVLVTGAAGFIGARVCERLIEDGYAVVAVDQFNHAYDVRLKTWRAARLVDRYDLRIAQVDISDRRAVTALFDGATGKQAAPFDAVINLAARAGVRQSVVDPWVYIDTNTTGTLNLLEQCRSHGVTKFVFSSTSSLYGRNNPMPYREDANTDFPLSPYAASKKAAEMLCYTYHYLHNLDVTVFRYFTVYGPAGRPDMSLFRFVQWIAEDRPVTIFGDGQQVRDFTFVDDIARGTVAGLKPMGYEIINLGSNQPRTLLEAVRLIEARLDKRANLVFAAAQTADMRASWADIGKAARLLGWQPVVSLETGIDRLVDWYLENADWAREIETGL